MLKFTIWTASFSKSPVPWLLPRFLFSSPSLLFLSLSVSQNSVSKFRLSSLWELSEGKNDRSFSKIDNDNRGEKSRTQQWRVRERVFLKWLTQPRHPRVLLARSKKTTIASAFFFFYFSLPFFYFLSRGFLRNRANIRRSREERKRFAT